MLQNMAIGGGRQSNLEALRLVCMLMILNLHSFWGYNHGSGIVQALDFFRETTSICAVNVFLLISGYFGIKWKWKSFYNLIFQIFFYSFGIYLVACGVGIIEFSISGLLQNVKGLYASWGFITGQMLLYFCTPILDTFVGKRIKSIYLSQLSSFYSRKISYAGIMDTLIMDFFIS